MSLVLAACGDSQQQQRTDGDAAIGDAASEASLPPVQPGDDGHADVVSRVPAGAVRAGRIKGADALLSGIKVEGRVGDVKIYNSKVAFIIQAPRLATGVVPYGGRIVDAARVGEQGTRARSLFGEVFLGVGTATLDAKSVAVVEDGSSGHARVRAIGTLAGIPQLASFVPGFDKPRPLELVVDYVLAPDSELLDIEVRLRNTSDKPLQGLLLLLGVVGGDGLSYLTPERGYDVAGASTSTYLAKLDRDVAYAVRAPGRSITALILRSNIWLHDVGDKAKDVVPPFGELSVRLQLLLAGGSPEALRAGFAAVDGKLAELGRRVSGVVRDGATTLAGARVHVARADGSYVTSALADSAGAYAVTLPAGSYRFTAVADGHEPGAASALDVAGGADATLDLATGPSGTFDFDVKDDAGSALPSKLTFMRSGGPPTLPASFGERTYRGGAALVHMFLGGQGSLQLPPGQYTITASRGFEYEIDRHDVTISAAQSSQQSFVLRRSVATDGYICGDFHVHAMWSFDANDLYEDKVTALAAEGVELPIATEHDYVGDYGPTISKLGLQKWMLGVVGNEVTTGRFGHFNMFPITADDALPAGGALPWFGRDPRQIFDDADARFPQAIFQVNHPRSTAFGYLHALGYDPVAGTFRVPGSWSTNFDALEVFNNSDFRDNADNVRDWLSLIERGVVRTATGASDSHNIASIEVGYPRTCLRLGTDEPAAVQLPDIVTAIKAHHAVVSGGAFITLESGGKQVGDVLATSANSSVDVHVVVRAPSWVDLETLEIYSGLDSKADPLLVKSVTLDSATQSPTDPTIRFDGTISVPVGAADSWIIAAAHGGPLAPVKVGAKAFGMTNPLFIDVDGNGKYDAPRSF
ncbi:MAG: carboxypeptidase regulatory-like domain-containing protein [Myxococcales bacterium]|nr:carboxypeptidase regulatory-like domain-containing protein [Myxococcales bacterium]